MILIVLLLISFPAY
ncbi:hypothetical protein APX71_13210 [Escherichia coli]|nr:type I toxin-antitoxin system Ibs family toxin [Escherichia coli]MBZ3661503.1 type I toxin-antitoxin system Ibs family toxin [Salmonella enterica subsp. enterica serovar Kentucky]QUJ01125.1 type I toxin-antitoxin system Ibs family toxin [Salmonella enterica subsp. enterica]EET4003494.1 type I toxin-antitoxin system Ibs family toxin [Escherichia coli]EEV1760799.1 type I toxin-antitoxin system Ibs family toxin [Escherichia coli]EFJ2068333.1 type I toxin-antitoxin system Ibs family toxin [Esch